MEHLPTSSAHRAGPWQVTPNGTIKSVPDIGKWDDVICSMPFCSFDEAIEIGPDQIANARLIAAAPKLLERCRMSLWDARAALSGEWEPCEEGWQAIIKDLEIVIAEAT